MVICWGKTYCWTLLLFRLNVCCYCYFLFSPFTILPVWPPARAWLPPRRGPWPPSPASRPAPPSHTTPCPSWPPPQWGYERPSDSFHFLVCIWNIMTLETEILLPIDSSFIFHFAWFYQIFFGLLITSGGWWPSPPPCPPPSSSPAQSCLSHACSPGAGR